MTGGKCIKELFGVVWAPITLGESVMLEKLYRKREVPRLSKQDFCAGLTQLAMVTVCVLMIELIICIQRTFYRILLPLALTIFQPLLLKYSLWCRMNNIYISSLELRSEQSHSLRTLMNESLL